MYRSLILAVTLVCAALSLSAQDDRLNSLNFDEEPLPEETSPYSAIGIGPALTLFMPNVTDINAKAKDISVPEVGSSLIMFGAEFYTAVGVVPNVRVGFSWLTGSASTSATSEITPGVTARKGIDYHLSTKTIHADYALRLSQSFTALPGIGISWGNTELSVHENVSSVDWGTVQTPTLTATNTQFAQSSLSAIPRLSFEYVLTPFLSIRAQGAYAVQFSASDWQANGYASVKNMPTSISMNGFSAQVGVFLGLFN